MSTHAILAATQSPGLSLLADRLLVIRSTFPAACFFPENTLPTQQTPTFVRNSFYNYGDWEVLPQNWHNSHNFTQGSCAHKQSSSPLDFQGRF